MLQTILKFYDRFAAENATNSNLQFEAAKAHARVGELRLRMNELNESEIAYRKALAMAGALDHDKAMRLDHIAFMAQARFGLALALQRSKRLAEAESEYRAAIVLQSPVVLLQQTGQTPPSSMQAVEPDQIMFLSVMRQNLGELLFEKGNTEEALSLLAASTAELQKCYDQTAYRRIPAVLARQYMSYSKVLAHTGNRKEADTMRDKARALDPMMPPSPRTSRDGFERRPPPPDDRPPPPPERE